MVPDRLHIQLSAMSSKTQDYNTLCHCEERLEEYPEIEKWPVYAISVPKRGGGPEEGKGGDGVWDKYKPCFPFNWNGIFIDPAAAALPVVDIMMIIAKAPASGYNVSEGISFL